jgi:hypothetical protein
MEQKNTNVTNRDLTGVNTPLEIKETEETKLIVTALGEIAPGTQASADFFNAGLVKEHLFHVSRVSVWNWCNGSYRISDKRLRFWRAMFTPGDVRHDLAVKLLDLRAQAEAVHWLGKPVSDEGEALSVVDGKKLLKAVRLKKAGRHE